MGKKIYLLRVALSFLAIFLLVAPMNVSAADEYNQFPLGLTYEEIKEFKVDEDLYIIPMPDVDVYGMSSNLDYTIDEQINLSNGVLYDYRTSLQNGSGSANFGELVTVTSGGTGYLTLTLYNAGNPLFSEKGIFNFMIQSYSTSNKNTAKITYSFTDGNTFEDTYTPTYGTDEFIEYSIENPSASLKMVEIKMSPNATMGLGIKKYGYIIDKQEEDNSKNIFELLVEWTGNFFGNMMDSLNNYDGTGVNDAASKFDQSAGELDSIESDLTNITNSSIETYTDSAFDTSVIASLGSSLVYVVTWFTNFWDMGGLFSSILNVGLALSIAFFILRLRGGD